MLLRVMIAVVAIVTSLTGAFTAFAIWQPTCQPAGQISPPFTQCYPIGGWGGSVTGCQVLIHIDSNGSIRAFTDPSQGLWTPDDTVVGIQNDWIKPIKSISLKSPHPIFYFDLDGMCATWEDGTPVYPNEPPGCPFGWLGYEGPMNYFPLESRSADKTSGLVNFWGPMYLQPGQCTYFSLGSIINTLCPPLPTTVPLIKQNASPWGTDIYDSISPSTIAGKGCNLTSAVMIINYQAARQGVSFSTTPRLLNNWLNSNNGYGRAGDVNPKAVEKYANINGITNFYYNGRVNSRNDFILDSYLCNGDPIMLGVKNNHHFVVATGQTTVNGTDSYSINDPYYMCADLAGVGCYNGTYSSMRLYSSKPKAPSGLFIYAHSPVELFMTSPNGQRSGFDVGTGETLLEIPESGYGVDSIEDAIDPVNGGTTPEVKSLEALVPASGNYSLQIIGTGTGTYTIDILAYDANGTESIQTITGSAAPGVGALHQVGYSSVAGSQVTQTFMNSIYTITASAGSGGSISPGTVVVNSGGSQAFTITPSAGYYVADVTVDNVSYGPITSYTFTNVGAPHTITVTFAAYDIMIPGTPPSYFSSLQSAYNASTSGNTLEIEAAVLTESPVFNLPISISIEGGYDSTFTNIVGYTTISGTLTIQDGTAAISNLVLE